MEDLDLASKDLGRGKSRDALGNANKIFKCAGCDLKVAVLKFMNRMKNEHKIPEVLSVCNRAQKSLNLWDNLFVLGAVINSVINGKEDPIQVQVQDVEKCFDKLAPSNN